MEVLMDSIALLGLCYSMGTLDVYISAVSAFMQDARMSSPYESREFKMVIEAMRRRKGLGKKKKPPVEPWHVKAILEGPVPGNMTIQQWRQGCLILLVGWQLFDRPEDFNELQVCDIEVSAEEMEVTIRYAKNDVRGLTRSPRLAREGGHLCPVGLWEEYSVQEGLVRSPLCDKVKGEPQRCRHCKPAFPAMWKFGGQQRHPIRAATVTSRVKELFMGLAVRGLMSAAVAKEFCGKSMRCGGVSAAAALAVREGVLQGHGGWLQRQSLRHYDLMRECERSGVSKALNKAMRTASAASQAP
jgi:hypothetical protein